MSLMSSLYVGKTGLTVSQNALNTTAHNLSNMDTTGYTRQQVSISDMQYSTINTSTAIANQQVGLGAVYSEVRQVRDVFLDSSYRKESGRSAFYSVSYEAMTEVEDILGELYGTTFSDSMTNIQEAIAELAKTPTDSTVVSLVIQRSVSFIESAQAVYQGLCDYQDNLNGQIKDNVETINAYAQEIHELNQQIVKIEAGGIENANDLRDTRNQLLDELSALASISYKEDSYGNVIVQLEGHDLVTRDLVYEIGLDEDPETGFYTPFWISDAGYTINSSGKKVYTNVEDAAVWDLTTTISSANNTDIGSTKALLLARGTKRANYTDLEDEETYENEISQSILMNIQAEFDQLIHSVVTTLNQIIADAADTSTGYLCETVTVNGVETYKPIQLFQTSMSDGYTYQTWKDEDGEWQSGWVYTEEDASEEETLYSTMNLIVNPDLVKTPTNLSFLKADGQEDYTTAAALADAFSSEMLTLNPNVTTQTSFADYYSSLVAQVANSGAVYKSISESQETTVSSIESSRESVLGVSSDEELTNMIKYQNAYNAASRYITVVNEMLEQLLSSLAS